MIQPKLHDINAVVRETVAMVERIIGADIRLEFIDPEKDEEKTRGNRRLLARTVGRVTVSLPKSP